MQEALRHIRHELRVDRHGENEPHPKPFVDGARLHAYDDCKDDEGSNHCDDGSRDGDGHGRVATYPITQHDGVGDQCVRGIHAGQQYRGHEVEVQQVDARQGAQYHGDEKCVYAEDDAAGFYLAEVVEVHFESHQKHEVEQTHVPENLEAAVVGQHIEPVRAEECSRQNQADDVGNPQFIEQQGGEQDNRQHDKEYQYRVGER